jgi:hypothetical protein
MKLPPAIMVHGLDHACAALAPGLPVTLLSGPGAASYAGVGWWQALVAEAIRLTPACCVIAPPDVLDCGDATGRALEAVRAGQLLLVLRAKPALLADVSERAARLGGTVLAEAPPALDLAQYNAARRLRDWLLQGQS